MGRSLLWSLEQLWVLGEGGGGSNLDAMPPPGSVERGGCAYLVAPTLGVHKHQQGLHEGGRGGPDDEGSPAALLGDTAVKLLQVLVDPSPMLAGSLGAPMYYLWVRAHGGPGHREATRRSDRPTSSGPHSPQ